MDSLLSPSHETPKRPSIFNRLGKATPLVAVMKAQVRPRLYALLHAILIFSQIRKILIQMLVMR